MDKKRDDQKGTSAADLAAREKMLDNRSVWMAAHDSAAADRDARISDREEIGFSTRFDGLTGRVERFAGAAAMRSAAIAA